MERMVFSSLGFQLVRLAHAHRNLIRCEMQNHGLHRGQPPVLFALHQKDGMSNSELAGFLEITPASVTNKVKRMEKAGLVIRRGDPEDERLSRAYLTDKGRGLLDELRQSMFEMEVAMLAGFDDNEVKLLKAGLKRVIDNIEAYDNRYK